MSRRSTLFLALSGLFLVAGCVVQPSGPSIAVMPSPYKPPEVFQQEDAACRQFAADRVSGAVAAANSQMAGSAAIGTLLGAGIGAAAGGGRGAAIGAASGAAVGTAAAAPPAARTQSEVQWSYDLAYGHCMYAKGNRVPGFPVVTSPPPPAIPPKAQ
jgi:uncharacterized protein YcfJ